MMRGKTRRVGLGMKHIDNIKNGTRASLGENVRVTDARTAWHKRSCAAGAANIRTGDAG